jgi:hypothetical protein
MSLQRWKGLNSEAEPKLDPNLTGIYTEAGEPVAIAVSKEYQQQIVIEHNLLVDILLPLAAYLPTLASAPVAGTGYWDCECGGINSDILRRCVMCKRLRTANEQPPAEPSPAGGKQ